MTKSNKIMLNGDSVTEIITKLSNINNKGTDETIEILLFECDQLSIDECVTISNLLSSFKDKFKILTFKDVSLKQLIILTSADREKRLMPATSSVLLKADNLTKEEITSISKHLSQPTKSKYTVEELSKDIENGKILDSKEVKKMKLCVEFTGEEPKRKKSKKSSKGGDKKGSPSSSSNDSSKESKVEGKSDQKDKDDKSKEPRKTIVIDKK